MTESVYMYVCRVDKVDKESYDASEDGYLSQ